MISPVRQPVDTLAAPSRITRWSLDMMPALLLFAGSFCVYAGTAAPTLSWRNGGADGGDLVTAAATLSVPHPSGYPAYLLLAQLFLRLPWGDEAYRLNLMSSFYAAAAVAILYTLLLAGSVGVDARARVSAMGGTAVLALAPLLWSQATIAEVYTLHLFLLVLTAWLVRRWWTSRSMLEAGLLGMVVGIGLGNHLTFVLPLPALTYIVFRGAQQAPVVTRGQRDVPTTSKVSVVVMAIALCVGLGVYLYIPMVAARDSYFHWGALDSPAAIWSHVSADLYHRYLLSLPPEDVPARALGFLMRIVSDFQWLGVLLAGLGLLAYAVRPELPRAWLWMTVWLALSNFSFALAYDAPGSAVYLLPVWLVVACWISWGFRAVLCHARARPLVYIALPVWLLLTVAVRWPLLDLSHDWSAERFARAALMGVPAGSVLITDSDDQTFALWYFSEVRNVRSDVPVIDRDLLAYAPARQAMQRHWHQLLVPADGDIEAFIAANRGHLSIFMIDPAQAVEAQPLVLTPLGNQE